MNEVYRAAVELQQFCELRGWQFCFIGGLAVQRWGNPRQTEDADATLLTGFAGEEQFVDELLASFAPRFHGERDRAVLRRVVLVKSSEGVGLDIALGGLDFEARSVARASNWRVSDEIRIRTCSAEDLIVHKAFAGREIDWADVASIVDMQGRKLNLEQIWNELRPLVELKEEPAIVEKLQRILNEHLD